MASKMDMEDMKDKIFLSFVILGVLLLAVKVLNFSFSIGLGPCSQ
jgi:hypothetical protein